MRSAVVRWLLSPRVPQLAGWMRYLVPPAAVLLALVVQSALLEKEGIAPFVLFFVAVAATSWVAGRGPGLLSVFLSAVFGNYFFVGSHRGWSLSRDELTATGLFLVSGGIVGFLSASFRQSALDLQRTIADQRITEQALRETEDALRIADRRKDEFLGVLSHELRNPLAPIRNAVYIMGRSDVSTEQAHRAREVIERQADHMAALVDELLDVTRIARGKIEVHPQRLDVRDVVRRVGEDHRALLERRGIELVVELSPDPCCANADPMRLSQIVGNLLHNAAKFTARGDRVVLAVAPAGEEIELEVRDTGAGIEPELLEVIFEPFTQGPQTLARTEGGLGLGLALVKGLTELHGGSVGAASDGVGRGAAFLVRLPRVTPAAGCGEPQKAIVAAAPSRRVLVVDDNEDAAESLAQIVQLLGHSADVAFDGPTAIEKVRTDPPDIVLCDIGLPGVSGYDVARQLQAQRQRGMKLVAVSGYTQPEHVKAALDAGFDRHVAKPPKPEEIAQLLA